MKLSETTESRNLRMENLGRLASSAATSMVNMVASGSTVVPPPPPVLGASGGDGGDGGSSTSSESYSSGSNYESSDSEIDESVLQQLEQAALADTVSDRVRRQFEKIKRRVLPRRSRRKKQKKKEREDRLERKIDARIEGLENRLNYYDDLSKRMDKRMEMKHRGKKGCIRMPVPEFGIPKDSKVVLPPGKVRKPPQTTLGDCMRTKMTEIAFPKSRFNGETGMGVREFLEYMNRGQKTCFLTEEDFKELLVTKCVGAPYKMVSNWINMGYSVDYIYQNLYSLYNTDLPPVEAQNHLTIYRPLKGMTFVKMTADIEDLARQACCNIEDPVKRTDYYNNMAIMALSNSLPPNGTRYVQEEQARLYADNGTPATYSELCHGLMDMQEAIDYELEHPPALYQFGKPRKTTAKIGSEHSYKNTSGHNNKGKSYKHRVNKITSEEVDQDETLHVNAVDAQPGTSQGHNSGNHNNKSRGSSGFSTRVSGGKKYCSMCGRYDHNPADRCSSMRDDRGKIATATLSTGPCQICRDRLSCDLFHNERFCHVRDKMIELYRKGDVTPVGKAAQYVYSIPGFKASRNNGGQNSGRSNNYNNGNGNNKNNNRGNRNNGNYNGGNNYNSNNGSGNNRGNNNKGYNKNNSSNDRNRNGSGYQQRNNTQ